jgi:hypothetical protein
MILVLLGLYARQNSFMRPAMSASHLGPPDNGLPVDGLGRLLSVKRPHLLIRPPRRRGRARGRSSEPSRSARGAPKYLFTNNGGELGSYLFDLWDYHHGVLH